MRASRSAQGHRALGVRDTLACRSGVRVADDGGGASWAAADDRNDVAEVVEETGLLVDAMQPHQTSQASALAANTHPDIYGMHPTHGDDRTTSWLYAALTAHAMAREPSPGQCL